MFNQDLIKGNEVFQKSYFKTHEKELLDLVKQGQKPRTLFIGCSDSRVDPALITQSNLGDLFVIRNIGNFIAPYKPSEDFHSTASAIEYAVSVLNVEEVIICGHSHCGACASLYEKIDDPELIHTKRWLDLGQKAKSMALNSLGLNANKEELLRLTEKLSIITQIENILTYPSVIKRVKNGTLYIHGWYYNIENGNIEYYDPDICQYVNLNDLQ